MTRLSSRASCKRAINVTVNGSTDGDDKCKYVEGNATLDHLAENSHRLGRKVHDTGSSTDSIERDHS